MNESFFSENSDSIKRGGKTKNALLEFLRIIQTEYKPGERLPPAPFFCKKLDVSKLTYGKILQTAKHHGHVRFGAGCGGVHVSERKIVKIGLLLGEGSRSAVIADRPLFIETLRALYNCDYAEQFIHPDSPETLSEEIVILNISLLVVFSWDECPNMPLFRRTATQSGIPIVIIGRWFQKEEKEISPNVCRIFSNGESAAKEIRDMLKENGRQRILSTLRMIEEEQVIFEKSGIEVLPHLDRDELKKDMKTLLRRIRKEHPDTLILDGGSEFYLRIMETLHKLPEKRRPTLFIQHPEHMNAEFRALADEMKIAGAYDLRTDLLALNAVDMIHRHLTKKQPLSDFRVNNFIRMPPL